MLYLVLTLLLIPVILSALLQIGSVQTFLAKKAAAYLSGKTGTTISIGKLRVTQFFDLELENLMVLDHRDSVLLNTTSLVVDIGRIKMKDHLLIIHHVISNDLTLVLRKYETDSILNLNHLLSFFASDDTAAASVEKQSWTVSCGILQITNGRFVLQNQNKDLTMTPAVDFNNLSLDSLNIFLSHILILKDTVFASIDRLTFIERSGLHVKRFQSDIKIGPEGIHAFNTNLVTNESNLDFDLRFGFDGFDAFSDFLHQVNIQTSIRASTLCAKDLAFFVPDLKELSYTIDLSGEFQGTVSNMKIRNLFLFYGSMTNLYGDVSITGLPDIKETYMHLKLKNSNTCMADVQQILTSGI